MRILRIILPVVLLGVLWQVADGKEAWARLAGADPVWLGVAFTALHGQTLLSAFRWRLISGALGQPIARAHAVREYYVAQIVNQTLPGGVIGDGARAVRAAVPTGGLNAAVGAVVLERAAGQIALLVVLVAGMLASFAAGQIKWPTGTLPITLAGLMILALVVAGIMVQRPNLGQLIRRAMAPQAHRMRLFALSGAIVALNLMSFAATAHATGTLLTAEASMTLIPLILSAMVIPLSIGGWGWREGAAAALFPLVGATAAAGLVASATYGVLVLAAALPGTLWLSRPILQPPV